MIEYRALEVFYRDQPLQIQYLSRRGYEETILYLEGLGSSKEDFVGAAGVAELQGHSLLAFDFPGCGGSPYPDEATLGMDDLVEITNIVVARLDLDDFIIIGHSMGGLVGLLYAEKYVERVKGFVDVEGNLASEDCFFSRKIASRGLDGFTREALDRLQQGLAASSSRGLREYAKALSSASEKALVAYATSLVDYSDNGNLIPRFVKLGIPKAFVYGSENGGLSYIPRLRDGGCEVVEIPDSGHLPFYDNPEAYYQVIASFLDSLPLDGGD